MFKILVPDMGEGIDKVQLVTWLFDEGQRCSEGEDVAELITDKAVFCIAAPASGVLTKKFILPGAEVSIGEVIAEIE